MRITKSRLAIWPGIAARMLALSAGLALVASLAAATGDTAVAGLTAAKGPAVAGRPTVQWGACPAAIPAQFQCATEPVPLSYQHPAGPEIGLALIRLPASDPSERIGSLFIDFGGPGGPDVTDLVNRADTVFSPAVRARFDLVTWDPRGVEDPIADWPGLASYLQGLYASTSAGRALAAGQSAWLAQAARRAQSQSLMGPQRGASGVPEPTGAAGASGAAAAPYTDNRADAFYAIQCADSLVPTSDAVYHNLAINEDQRVPGFGRLIVYDMTPCASWPTMHTDAYDGPWNRSRTPILVINAVHDPITPIWGAEAAVGELGSARLLKVNGDGHTSMFVEPSTCRDDAELAYLVSLQLPAKGTVCNVDQLPWGLSPRA
jgi:pimeloyl-ACP methyl ester carboxylesterase